MRQNLDVGLLAIILALGAISISIIFAANKGLAQNQLIFWVFGLLILFAASRFFYPDWQRFSLPFYLASIIALFAVLTLGESVRGSVRWIDLGAFRLQPSEIAKVAAIMLLATFFLKRSAQKLSNVILSFLIILPPFTLIFIQPDIGSSMAIVAIWLAVNFGAGLKIKHILSVFLVFLLIGVLSYEILAPYQKDRIATFLNPAKDPLGAGYNIIQSKIAIGSGQLLGRGLGRGSQSQLNFLPENESDFIFASIGEQLGFLGAGLIIILFVLMLLKISSYSQQSDRFGQLIITGALGLFAYQFSVNVGMNMGIIPVTGITLPLVSYGGSSLISSLLLLGIILSARRQQY